MTVRTEVFDADDYIISAKVNDNREVVSWLIKIFLMLTLISVGLILTDIRLAHIQSAITQRQTIYINMAPTTSNYVPPAKVSP
jgi:hypothetical protein